MLATWRSAPDHLRLVSVELKLLGSHPPANVAYAVRNTALELVTVTRLIDAVSVNVISVEMGVQAVCTNPSKQICSLKKKQNQPKNRSLGNTGDQTVDNVPPQ